MAFQQSQTALAPTRAGSLPAVFDRECWLRQALGDNDLAREVLGLFLGHVTRLEEAAFSRLDLAFEMHTLRGAAAAIGAAEIEAIATRWRDLGPGLEAALRKAFQAFRAACRA